MLMASLTPKIIKFPPRGKLHSNDAEKIIRTIKRKNVIFSIHAFERMEEREILKEDVHWILENGYADTPNLNNNGEWEVIMERKLRGERKAGIVTVILSEKKLFIKTVLWRDK